MNRTLLSIVTALAVMLFLAAPLCAKPWGIVATGPDFYDTSDNDSIHVIDLGEIPPKVYGPFLQDQLTDARGDGVLDIAMLPGNRKALISTFENQKVHVVNLADPTNPIWERSFDLPFPAEDIAISRNKKLAIVTDGGFSSWVAFINLQKTTVSSIELGDGKYAQAVAIARNNVAIFADYFNGAIHYGKINKARTGLESVQTIALCDEGQYDNATNCMGPVGQPLNVSISPDGQTALVAPASGGVVFVLKITKKGEVLPGDPFILTGLPGGTLEMPEGGQQSIAFQDKKTAFVVSQRYPLMAPGDAVVVPGGIAFPGAEGDRPNQLSQINITGPGKAEFVSARYTLLNSPIIQLFGVDTLDIFKQYALVGNANDELATPYDNPYYNNVAFIDLITGVLTPIELNNYGVASGVAIKP